jgi:hypothetical protein
LQGLSGACKTPVNGGILMMVLFPHFRIFTRVAAHERGPLIRPDRIGA